jgi:hypothetical protein
MFIAAIDAVNITMPLGTPFLPKWLANSGGGGRIENRIVTGFFALFSLTNYY